MKRMYTDDADVCYQLDLFHTQKAIRGSSPDRECERNILMFLKRCNLDGMFEYIKTVADSLETLEAEEKMRRLYAYLYENKRGLIPYQRKIERLPKLNEGLGYRNMGNCEHNVYLTVKNIVTIQLPEHYAEEITHKIFSAGKTPKTVGKGYEVKNCHLPLFDTAVTETMKGFKRMLFN